VFFATVKFAPLTLLEGELTLLLSLPLAWATYRFVEVPIRFGRPSARKIAGLCAAMVLVALAGAVVVWDAVFDLRLPAEIRAMGGGIEATVELAASPMPARSRPRYVVCQRLRRSKPAAAGVCVGRFDGGRADARVRKAQETRNFGTRSSLPAPAFRPWNADIRIIRTAAPSMTG